MGYSFMTAAKKKTEKTPSHILLVNNLKQQNNRQTHQQHYTHHHIIFSTFTVFPILFSIMIQQQGVQATFADIKVNEYGVRPLKHGDTAMVFYANASHTGGDGDLPITARLKMEKCCFILPPNKTSNCDSMRLISGLGIVFHPKHTHILQMYFVNFDLYDREGKCDLRLLFKSENHGESWENGPNVTIPFMTVQPKPGLLKKLFSGSSKGYRICNTDNYNALHECSNFDDCLIRFAGSRSLFRKESKECEPTPECGDSGTNFLSIVTRKCEKSHDVEHIRKSFTYDIKHLLSIQSSDANRFSDHSHYLANLLSRRSNSTPEKPNLVCEHGVHVTGKDGRPNCTCHSGWRSLTLEEWEQKGGIMNNDDEGLPMHHMCTVLLMDHKTRGYIILAFIGVCITVPFAAMLIYNQRKKTGDLERRNSSVKDFLEEEPILSSSDDDKEDENDDEERRKHKKINRRSVHEMEEEEADKVISEIANRREPQMSRKPSKKDDDDNGDDNPPQPPPSSATSGMTPQTSEHKDVSSNSPSKSNWSIPWHPSQQTKQPATPPPTATPSKSSTKIQSSPTNPNSGGVSARKQMKYYTPSGGFDYKKGQSEKEDNELTLSEVNMNKMVATQAPSTDDLLNLTKQETYRAHVPMRPKTGEDKGVSVVVANCATVELRDNNVTLHSMSSEEITQRKKEEWAQFIKSVSEEKFHLRPGHCSISIGEKKQGNKVDEIDSDDEEEVEEYSRIGQIQLPDFHYFHKDHKPKALKVRSVPGMMQYHPFSSSTAPPQNNDQLPEPPARYIQKAFGEMPPEELASRQECYRILSSLSNERVSSQEGTLRGTNSIWSNIASENTKQPSTTPATTAEGSRVVSSYEDGIAVVDKNLMLRTDTIYGNMGSDIDSDGALDQLATSSSGHRRFHERKRDGVKREEFVTRNNSTLYGSTSVPIPTMMMPTPQQVNQDQTSVNQLILEADTIPSDIYILESPESSRMTSRTPSNTELWKTVALHIMGGNGTNKTDETNGGNEAAATTSSTRDDADMNTETTSAYRIKSSLETALKASKSRSGTNLF